MITDVQGQTRRYEDGVVNEGKTKTKKRKRKSANRLALAIKTSRVPTKKRKNAIRRDSVLASKHDVKRALNNRAAFVRSTLGTERLSVSTENSASLRGNIKRFHRRNNLKT